MVKEQSRETMMRAECLVRTSLSEHPWPAVINDPQENGRKEFPCPLCAYTTPYRHRYMEHLSTHYSDKCTLCDFTGQSAQDLKNHLQDVHNISDIEDLSDPQDNNSDFQEDDETPNKRGKSKSFKCKQCNYVTSTKLDFWEHSKGHIKAEKLLTCPKCPFVTEYKHHLEYHLRNHFGSKPFKCSKCSYSCVNKSMLNSHLKSHSNVYQYRCSDCAYATKYCHSLKLHLRKYNHKPAMVLNADGSPNPLPIIDIYGTRRGPKQKSNKTEEPDYVKKEDKNAFVNIKVPYAEKKKPNLPGGVVVPNASQISPHSPSPVYPLNNNDIKEEPRSETPKKFICCNFCEFHTVLPDVLNQHMFLHAAETNLVHMLKTNNNLQDQAIKDYLQSIFNHIDRPFMSCRTVSPLCLVSSKPYSPENRQSAIPLDLRKQDNCESENDTSQESKQTGQIKSESDGRLPSTKHRRKGKAYKLERINERFDSSPEDFYSSTTDEDSFKIKIPEFKLKNPEEESNESMKMEEDEKIENPNNTNMEEKSEHEVMQQQQQQHLQKQQLLQQQLLLQQQIRTADNGKELHICIYCDIAFRDVVMYTMHMGYHGYQDPFTCNMCGHVTSDKVSFFLHIARSSHS